MGIKICVSLFFKEKGGKGLERECTQVEKQNTPPEVLIQQNNIGNGICLRISFSFYFFIKDFEYKQIIFRL
jgi:hypothetical protein